MNDLWLRAIGTVVVLLVIALGIWVVLMTCVLLLYRWLGAIKGWWNGSRGSS